MTATGTGRRCWLAAALLFVLIRAIPNISYPIGRDQATYFVIGEGLLRGQRLYRDLWDNKPPGIFVLYALLGKLFHHLMWSVGLFDILWLLAIAYCIFRFAERYLGAEAAAVAVAVYADWHCRFGYTDAGETESFVMLLAFIGYLAIAGGRPWPARPGHQPWREDPASEGRWPLGRNFAAGLCLGAAFWLKYNALVFLPFVALLPHLDWSRFDERPHRLGLLVRGRALLKREGALLAGFSILVMAVLGYFYLAGSWPFFKEVQFEVLPRYGAMAVERTPDYWITSIALMIRFSGLLTWVAVGLAFLMAEWRDLSRLAPVLAAAAVGMACTASQLRMRALSLETCYPFFAMVWGYVVVKTFEWLRYSARSAAARERALAWAAACALGMSAIFWPLRTEVRTVAERYRDLAAWRRNSDAFFANYPAIRFLIENLRGQMQVIRALRQASAPGDGVFVWGTDPLIYYMTGLLPPTRFVSNLALVSPWGPPAWREELVRDLGKRPPAFIVVAQHDKLPEITFTSVDSEQYLSVYPRLARFISSSYDLMAAFPDFLVYRRKPRP